MIREAAAIDVSLDDMPDWAMDLAMQLASGRRVVFANPPPDVDTVHTLLAGLAGMEVQAFVVSPVEASRKPPEGASYLRWVEAI